MGWVTHGVRAKMESDKGFRNNVAEPQTRICQQKTRPPEMTPWSYADLSFEQTLTHTLNPTSFSPKP